MKPLYSISAMGAAIFASALGASVSVASPAETSLKPVPQAILDRYNAVEKLVRTHADYVVVNDALYWPEAVITSEGDKTGRGRRDALEITKETMDTFGRDCGFEVEKTGVITTRLADVLGKYVCNVPGKGTLKFRLQYTWELRGRDWKVVHETSTADVK